MMMMSPGHSTSTARSIERFEVGVEKEGKSG